MAKIEKDRPLPSHTKLDYDECYAKIVLEKFYPDQYENLQISDKPDLRDISNNIGIEVTSAIPQSEQEAMALACEIPYLEKEKQDKRIAYLKKKGYNYTQYGMTGPGMGYAWTGLDYPDIRNTWCKYFLSAVETKMKKLNTGGYASMKRYDLFVNSELFIELSLDGLFVFNLEKQTVSPVETGEKLYGLGMLARKMVEEGEEDD